MSTLSQETLTVAGAVGPIEVLCDRPKGHARGVAVITHPHPLLGGSADHKIPHQIARTLQAMGYLSLRPNFRGVGGSADSHDFGIGETDDILTVVQALADETGALPLVLVGFSFGAYVQARVADRLLQIGQPPAALALIGTPFGVIGGERYYDTPPVPPSTLVIHGEKDEIVPLAQVLDWVRPQSLPVVVLPAANHFFTGRLSELQSAIRHYVGSLPTEPELQQSNCFSVPAPKGALPWVV